MALEQFVKTPDPRGEEPKPADSGPPVVLVSDKGTRVTASGALVDTLKSQGYTVDGEKAATTVAPDGPPPKSGAGSGVEAWAAYAAAQGVEIPEGAKRDDIVAALETAGVPTE